jgi:hypothetical protein
MYKKMKLKNVWHLQIDMLSYKYTTINRVSIIILI